MQRLLISLLIAAALSGCASTDPKGSGRVIDRLPPEAVKPAPPPLPKLTQQDLIQLSRQGLSSEAIIQRLKESHTRLRLGATELIALRTSGVPLLVLDHLLDSDRKAILDQCDERTLQLRNEHAVQLQQLETLCWQRCTLHCAPWFPPAFPRPYHRWR